MDDPVVSNEQSRKETEGKGLLPLLPLAISSPSYHFSPPAITLPTLDMRSGGMVTMVEETGINRQT